MLTPGFWPSTYFCKNYWADDYWPNYGVAVAVPDHLMMLGIG